MATLDSQPVRCVVILDDLKKTWKVDHLNLHLERQIDEISKKVGGYFDVVSLGFGADLMGFANDTGAIDGLPTNALAAKLLQRAPGTHLHGPIVITGRDGWDVAPISDEWLEAVRAHALSMGWAEQDARPEN